MTQAREFPEAPLGMTAPVCPNWHRTAAPQLQRHGRGWQIVAFVPPAMSDDLFERVTHRFVFLSEADARKCMKRIGGVSKMDGGDGVIQPICLDNWTWEPSVCSAYGFMHHRPAV